jgi:phosphatidylethanolamine/phosphatidyl-N-methylethanolamine N-methyltransferase
MYPASVKVTGIDLSSEMLAKARARVARRKLGNVEALLEMDAETMSFPDASFDKVVAMYVMPVVRDPARVLEEFHRVCRPDGEIYLVNHVRSDNRLLGALEKGLARFSNQLGFRPDFELRELVNGAGQIDEVARINLLWRVMRVRNGVAHRRVAASG